MRLIDKDKLHDEINDNWCGISVCTLKDILDFIDDTETIDPETLPIVQELRANISIQEKIIKENRNPFDKEKIVKLSLENANLKQQLGKVTEERDKAVDSLENICMFGDSPCKYCSEGDKCLFNDSPEYCRNFEWIGLQEVE